MSISRAYLERLKKLRHKRILKRAGKPLLVDEDQMIAALANRRLPTMMQHCIIKVHKKMGGTDKERYISAVNICTWVFQKYGYMKHKSFDMTSKGQKNNQRHMREREASTKRAKFNMLTNRLWRGSINRYMKDQKQKTDKE